MTRQVFDPHAYLYPDVKGQIGPIFIFAMGIVLIGFYYTILSPVLYDFTEYHNDMHDSGDWAIPQAKIDALTLLQYAWKALPILLIIILIIWVIMASLRENTGETV